MTGAENIVRILGIVQRDRESGKPFFARHRLGQNDSAAHTGATIVMRPIEAGGRAPQRNQRADRRVQMVGEEAADEVVFVSNTTGPRTS